MFQLPLAQPPRWEAAQCRGRGGGGVPGGNAFALGRLGDQPQRGGKTDVRFNLDAFYLFNVQGFNNPNATDGTQVVLCNGVSSSYDAPRQLQMTLLLTF